MASNTLLEVVTDIVQGIISVILVGSLAGIAVYEATAGKPFTEPATLAALAGVAVTYYFGQRQLRRQQDQIQALTSTIVNGGKKE